MANTYYEHDNPFIAGTLVASAGVNSQLDLIETGFEAVETTFSTRIQFPDSFSGNHKIPAQSLNNKLLMINSSGDADLYNLADIDTAVAAAAASATASADSATASAASATLSADSESASAASAQTAFVLAVAAGDSDTAAAASATAAADSATEAAASATDAANTISAATTNNVLRTGNQTIAGTKTFSAQIVGSFTTSVQTEADIVTAQTRADLGVTNASTAQTRADLGVTNAATAQTRADLGVTNAATAQARADLGVTNAAAAAGTANTAVINASAASSEAATAQSTANTGVNDAAAAQATASAALPKTGGTMTGELQVNARLDVGTGSNTQTNSEIRIFKGDNNVSDHIQFYNGTTRVGEIGCEDDSWLRINQETAKNILTPRYIRADGGFFVNGTTKGINGSGNYIGGTITGASDANVANWNSAYTTAGAALPKAGGTLTGTVYMQNYVVAQGSHRDKGVFGTYDSTKTQHIWSMGTNYRNAADGSDYGDLYGLAYKYSANGAGHCINVVANGVEKCSFGTSIWTSGNVTAYSDRRVKTDIEVIPNALDKVCQLSGYTFLRTDTETEDADGNPVAEVRQTGVIAQEVLEVLPEAVMENEEGMYSVAYGNMVGLLIEAIKEQQVQIDELKASR